jgi:solute carrier family 25 protein 38
VNSLATVGGGALSRSLAAAALCPVTVVKTRMEYSGVSGVKYANTVQALLR